MTERTGDIMERTRDINYVDMTEMSVKEREELRAEVAMELDGFRYHERDIADSMKHIDAAATEIETRLGSPSIRLAPETRAQLAQRVEAFRYAEAVLEDRRTPYAHHVPALVEFLAILDKAEEDLYDQAERGARKEDEMRRLIEIASSSDSDGDDRERAARMLQDSWIEAWIEAHWRRPTRAGWLDPRKRASLAYDVVDYYGEWCDENRRTRDHAEVSEGFMTASARFDVPGEPRIEVVAGAPGTAECSECGDAYRWYAHVDMDGFHLCPHADQLAVHLGTRYEHIAKGGPDAGESCGGGN
ncbi:MAG: hypothetical protein M3P49_09820 [Actinomycetota bacterium]|nr:hypothetical protein [Actinomycetota bacterium]